jgi:signal transduction histidine kinase
MPTMTDRTLTETDLPKLRDADKAGDWMTLRDAIDRAGDALKHTNPTDASLAPLAEKLSGYSEHTKWQVRKAVAHAAQNLRHEASDTILARLASDTHAYVRDAAQRSRARRAEAAQSGLLEQQHADLMQKRLAELEAAHGPAARAAALRVGKQYTELLMREAYHEVVRVLSAQDLALTNLETVIGRAAFDRDAALAHVKRAKDRRKHLGDLFQSLREFATAPSEAMQREDVHGIVAEAVELVADGLRRERPLLAERFTPRVAIDRSVAVTAHRHRLVQAIRNLVQNAVESYDMTDAGPAVVTISAKKSASTVTLVIADEGCGMAAEAVADAFQLFATSKSYGTGVGLALVQSVVESEHEGSVRLVSSKGSGTTVTVVLPIEQRRGKR